MRMVLLLLTLITPASGLAFAYAHFVYWTQPGNCSSCHPEMFSRSIAYGISFVVLNVILWQAGEALYPWTDGLSRFAKKVLIGLLISVAACFILIGIAILPVVAVLASLGYLVFFAAAVRHIARGN
jgi:hypothetical protein